MLQRDGPLFRGRYRAIVVDADTSLLQVSRYMHLNPMAACLVQRPEIYVWLSYGAYVGQVQGPDAARSSLIHQLEKALEREKAKT